MRRRVPTFRAGEQPLADVWAIRHAGATRHTGFREIMTAFLRATPAPQPTPPRAGPAMGVSRYCCRCDQPILPDQEYQQLDKFSVSGGGIALHEHTVCQPPERRVPEPRRAVGGPCPPLPEPGG